MSTPKPWVTDWMEDALRRLQVVPAFDYDAAYNAAFMGSANLNPGRNASHADYFQGGCLALRLWTKRMTDTVNLRAAAGAKP